MILKTQVFVSSLHSADVSYPFTYMLDSVLVIISESRHSTLGFPCSSAGKESTCNAGDPGSIPGLGRSPGEEVGYPVQYSWASLVDQLVKNLPAMQETWV